jgi:hypothetical protein
MFMFIKRGQVEESFFKKKKKKGYLTALKGKVSDKNVQLVLKRGTFQKHIE